MVLSSAASLAASSSIDSPRPPTPPQPCQETSDAFEKLGDDIERQLGAFGGSLKFPSQSPLLRSLAKRGRGLRFQLPLTTFSNTHGCLQRLREGVYSKARAREGMIIAYAIGALCIWRTRTAYMSRILTKLASCIAAAVKDGLLELAVELLQGLPAYSASGTSNGHRCLRPAEYRVFSTLTASGPLGQGTGSDQPPQARFQAAAAAASAALERSQHHGRRVGSVAG